MSSSTKTGQKLRKRFKKELPFHLMLLPAVVMVVLFKYIPMAGLSIAFQDYSPLYSIFEQEWCGWENFKYIFSLSTFPTKVISRFISIDNWACDIPAASLYSRTFFIIANSTCVFIALFLKK